MSFDYDYYFFLFQSQQRKPKFYALSLYKKNWLQNIFHLAEMVVILNKWFLFW